MMCARILLGPLIRLRPGKVSGADFIWKILFSVENPRMQGMAAFWTILPERGMFSMNELYWLCVATLFVCLVLSVFSCFAVIVSQSVEKDTERDRHKSI